MRVLFQEMMLGGQDVIESAPVGELDLVEGVLDERMFRIIAPGFGQLELVKPAKLHSMAKLARTRRMSQVEVDVEVDVPSLTAGAMAFREHLGECCHSPGRKAGDSKLK